MSTSMLVKKSSSSSSANHRKSSTMRLIIMCLFLMLFAASQYLLAQPIKKQLLPDETTTLYLPIYTAMIEACSFPFLIAFYVIAVLTSGDKTKGISRRTFAWPTSYRMSVYVLLASIDAVDTLVSSFGLNMLPPAVHTVLKASSLVFSVALTKALTKKKLTPLHYGGAAIVLLSTIIIAISSYCQSDNSQNDHHLLMGFCGSLFSSFLTALLGVISYRFFTHENAKGSMVDIAEVSAYQSTMAFFMMLPLLATPEAGSWSSLYTRIGAANTKSLFWFVSLGLYVCSPLVMFTDLAVTAHSSNVLTRALSGPRRIIVIVGGWLFFNESMPISKIVAIVVMMVGISVYVYGGMNVKAEKDNNAITSNTDSLESPTIAPEVSVLP